ncbi:sterol methyltransferase C-terminal-domain-containing protein [Lactarius sanguifluus]|nr:sterol methyltransferase C-terminal-domain-containing protein [Lactarius sanguifluus]
MAPTKLEDGRVGSRIENYAGFWQKDIKKEVKADSDVRVENYTDVVNGYYDGATELYEYGWAKSFHFSRFYKGEAFAASLARHEHYLAAQMALRPGMRVLDVGCGYTKDADLQDQVQFVKGDFMKLSEQFGENSFDAVYAIEATVHAPTWEGVYGEILRFSSPEFGVYEWCMTDRWDPSIPEHKALAHEIELGNGIPEMLGFKIEHEEDLADRPDSVPWYYPLEGDIWKAQTAWDYFTVWRMSWSGKLVTHNALRILELFSVVPKGTWEVGETLRIAADALVKGGQTKLFTPMYLVVARKP